MTRKKLIAVLGAAVLVVALATAAFAYWTTSGNGIGTGSTATGTADELSFNTTPLAAMYPGDSAQEFTVTVTNNDASQTATVTNLKAYVTTDSLGTCDGSDFLLNGSPAPSVAGSAVALHWTQSDIAAGASAATDTHDTIQFNDKVLTKQDDCKGVGVTLHYLAS
jgi:azurin